MRCRARACRERRALHKRTAARSSPYSPRATRRLRTARRRFAPSTTPRPPDSMAAARPARFPRVRPPPAFAHEAPQNRARAESRAPQSLGLAGSRRRSGAGRAPPLFCPAYAQMPRCGVDSRWMLVATLGAAKMTSARRHRSTKSGQATVSRTQRPALRADAPPPVVHPSRPAASLRDVSGNGAGRRRGRAWDACRAALSASPRRRRRSRQGPAVPQRAVSRRSRTPSRPRQGPSTTRNPHEPASRRRSERECRNASREARAAHRYL